MAIVKKEYGAFITCDGKPLDEYQVSHEDERTHGNPDKEPVNQNFEIHYQEYISPDGEDSDDVTLDGNEEDLPGFAKRLRFYVDGRLAASLISSYGESNSWDGFDTGEKELRLFKFEDVVMTDDDSVSKNPPGHDDIGSIEVRIQRVRTDWKPLEEVWVPAMPEAPWGESIHEKSKKLGSHWTTPGDVVQTEIPWCAVASSHDEEDYAVFRFNYRKREYLQAQGIIPYSPPPEPEQSDSHKRRRESEVSEEEDCDEETLEQIEARLQEIRGKLARKRVKKEPVSSHFSGAVEVIDLT